MSRIFITGSADGLGQLCARLLIQQGHEVVLHARNAERGKEALRRVSGARTVLTADLSSINETKDLAEKANALGAFDAVIHNAGVYQVSSEQIFAVNSLAPFILTSLMEKPKRLIYLSSGMHLQGKVNIDGVQNNGNGISYSDSKLHVMMLAKAVARKWQNVYANAVDPGWVPTKMGGRNAPDNLQKGFETQAWLAVSEDQKAKVSGHYFFHKKERSYNTFADDVALQEELFTAFETVTGVSFPKA